MDSWVCVYVKTCITQPYVPKNVTNTHILYIGTHTLHGGQGEGEFTDKQVFIHWEDLVQTEQPVSPLHLTSDRRVCGVLCRLVSQFYPLNRKV